MEIHRASSENPDFIYALRNVTEAAARAAYHWIGRGDKNQGDGAAVEAMRAAIADLKLNGVVVIGEGAKDEAPELYNGEEFGDSNAKGAFDIAVDPVEGTSYLAKGITNAMAVLAVAPRGSMFDVGPVFYMEKFAAPPAAKGKIDPAAPTEEKLKDLAKALGKSVSDLNIYVLEKPRHKPLTEAINKAGARVALYPAGDVAGALLANIPDSGIDALMGTGGTPEGVISACAARALGGEFLGRLNPQLPSEQAEVIRQGMDTTKWFKSSELVTSEDVYFSATGITTGLLFEGVERVGSHETTQSLLITGKNKERQLLKTFYPR